MISSMEWTESDERTACESGDDVGCGSGGGGG